MQTLLRLSRADVVFYILPPLMILLIVGTLAQKTMGLYAAHTKFFASFIVWWGVVPLPAGYTLVGLLGLCLALKFVLKTEWSKKKAGIALAHLGALILLFGGLITSLSAQEWYMVIPEGGKTPYMFDYHRRNLSLYYKDYLKIEKSFEGLKQGDALSFGNLRLTVINKCENCEIIKREDVVEEPSGNALYQGMARFMALRPDIAARDPEENISGLTFKISYNEQESSEPKSNTENTGDEVYIAFEGMPQPVKIEDYTIVFGKAQTLLPFAIGLKDFKAETYKDIERARSFSSDIEIDESGVVWPAYIEMNKPYRYRGYTFYQSSYGQEEGGREYTILAVVKNGGRIFPYIGTGILAFGLLLHLLIKVKSRKNGVKT